MGDPLAPGIRSGVLGRRRRGQGLFYEKGSLELGSCNLTWQAEPREGVGLCKLTQLSESSRDYSPGLDL